MIHSAVPRDLDVIEQCLENTAAHQPLCKINDTHNRGQRTVLYLEGEMGLLHHISVQPRLPFRRRF
jgi:hypothetical protein